MLRYFSLACALAALMQTSVAVASDSASSEVDKEGFRAIFNGNSLEGWDGDPRFWRVEEGVIVGQTTASNPAKYNNFLIWRGGKPADFELKAEFRMPDAGFANSGIQIRSWEGPKKWQVSGYQPDMDLDNHYTGICYGENYRGILAQRGQKVVIGTDHKPRVVEQFGDSAELAKFIKKGDWNEYHILARGNHIVEKINGQLMCELTDEDSVARAAGVIALQIHAGPPMKVQFRNLRLKELPKEAKPAKADAAKRKIVFVAGSPSHGYADHEYHADCLLFAKWLKAAYPNVETMVSRNGWPKDPHAFDGVDAVVICSDGGGGHPMLPHLDQVEKLMKQGVGLACIHYAVEVPKGKAGDLLKDWIGGYFETFWSVNPFWNAEFKQFPDHPVAHGLKPFAITDEWYYNMRFVDDMQGVTPILTATPPESTRRAGRDSHGANEFVRAQKGRAEHLAWVRERPDGGRGFGFTGGHPHWNWANRGFRTVVLNGIAWVAKLDVPPDGVPSEKPTFEELAVHLDKPQPANFDREKVRRLIESW
jgi:type 1 glutamine amidotransferase